MRIEPVGQRIVVKRLSGDEIKGIILPRNVKDHSLIGEVIAKGPDAEWVEVGDVVSYARFSGMGIVIDHKYIGTEYDECLYMNCEDILGVIKEKDLEVVA